MKKLVMSVIVFLLFFNLSITAFGSEAAVIQLVKDSDGIKITALNVGTIQSIQMDVLLEGSQAENVKMVWNPILEQEYKHFETTKTTTGTRVTFYVDSKKSLNVNHSVSLGKLSYTGYQQSAAISSSGTIKTLNIGIQEKTVQASVEVTMGSGGGNSGGGDNGGGNNGGGSSGGGNNGGGSTTESDVPVNEDKKTEEIKKIIVDSSKKSLEINRKPDSVNQAGNSLEYQLPEIAFEKDVKTIALTVRLEKDSLLSAIKETKKSTLSVAIMIPESMENNKKINWKGILFDQTVLNAIKEQKKIVTFSVKNSKNQLIYSIKFNYKNITTNKSDTNIGLSVSSAAKNSAIDKASSAKTTGVVSFLQKSSFASKPEVVVNVKQFGWSKKNVLHLNFYNTKTKTLQYQSRGTKISESGYAAFSISKGGTYTLTTEGFVTTGNTKKYYKGNTLLKGLTTIKENIYYFDKKSGVMSISKFVKVGKNQYYFGKDGKAVRGKQKIK